MFDYRQIEAFGAVIEYGGFDRAADALGLTQSAVTQRVKHLESYVGEPLLVRSNPPVPTKAGIPLYSHFKKYGCWKRTWSGARKQGFRERPYPWEWALLRLAVGFFLCCA